MALYIYTKAKRYSTTFIRFPFKFMAWLCYVCRRTVSEYMGTWTEREIRVETMICYPVIIVQRRTFSIRTSENDGLCLFLVVVLSLFLRNPVKVVSFLEEIKTLALRVYFHFHLLQKNFQGILLFSQFELWVKIFPVPCSTLYNINHWNFHIMGCVVRKSHNFALVFTSMCT